MCVMHLTHSFEPVIKYTENCQNSLDGLLLFAFYLDFVAISNYSFTFCCLACIINLTISYTKIIANSRRNITYLSNKDGRKLKPSDLQSLIRNVIILYSSVSSK